jgi:hypothetical protein
VADPININPARYRAVVTTAVDGRLTDRSTVTVADRSRRIPLDTADGSHQFVDRINAALAKLGYRVTADAWKTADTSWPCRTRVEVDRLLDVWLAESRNTDPTEEADRG